MPAPSSRPYVRTGAQVGWEAAWLEVEHQAAHWGTPAHGETGVLIAEALRAAALIGRAGGLHCAHRAGSAAVPATLLQAREPTPALAPSAGPGVQRPPAAA
jgi:hypothetical protein